MTEPVWGASLASLRSREAVPAAQATAELLERAEARWSGQVIARTSMHDLLFTVPGAEYPFHESLRVSWNEGVFEFKLLDRRGLVSADRCFETKADLVLDAFLMQLVPSA